MYRSKPRSHPQPLLIAVENRVIDTIFLLPPCIERSCDECDSFRVEVSESVERRERVIDRVAVAVFAELKLDRQDCAVGLHRQIVSRFEVDLVLLREPHRLVVPLKAGQDSFIGHRIDESVDVVLQLCERRLVVVLLAPTIRAVTVSVEAKHDKILVAAQLDESVFTALCAVNLEKV